MRSLAVLLCVALFFAPSLQLTFPVKASGDECFYEDLDSGSIFSGSFQVMEGGALDIDFQAFSPSNEVLYNVERKSEDRFQFSVPSGGTYKFCFINKMSTWTPKLVNFQLSSRSTVEDKSQQHSAIEESIRTLNDALSKVQSEQQYMRVRERVHRNTSESINGRVLWWSLLQLGVLVVVSVAQIVYLRRFFDVKQSV